jgi:hypothetical protein
MMKRLAAGRQTSRRPPFTIAARATAAGSRYGSDHRGREDAG